MPRGPLSSRQTRELLNELVNRTPAWQHGYDLSKATGLRSGTLYPILARLAEHGFLETMWEAEQPAGRPRRHLYRLTAAGCAAAAELEHEAGDARPSPGTTRSKLEVRHAH